MMDGPNLVGHKSTCVSDPRRLVMSRATGAVRILNEIQPAYDDLLGAAEVGDVELMAFSARTVVLSCLSVLSLAVEGEPDSFFGDRTTHDPFAGLDEDMTQSALALAAWPYASSDPCGARCDEWLAQLEGLVGDVERSLQLPRGLPELRSPEGMFGAMSMARDWLVATESLGLPPILPDEWTSSGV